MTGDSFLECNRRRKKNQFAFLLGLNDIKRLWCNTDVEMHVFSILVNGTPSFEKLFFNRCVCSVLSQSI